MPERFSRDDYGAGGLAGESPGAAVGGYGALPRDRQGRNVGKGPRNYRRSDDRIADDVCRRLTDADDVDASEIVIRVENGVLTMSGTVDDRYQRRAAEDAVCDIWGVQDVRNELRVQPAGRSSQASRSGTAGVNAADTGGTPVRQP